MSNYDIQVKLSISTLAIWDVSLGSRYPDSVFVWTAAEMAARARRAVLASAFVWYTAKTG